MSRRGVFVSVVGSCKPSIKDRVAVILRSRLQKKKRVSCDTVLTSERPSLGENLATNALLELAFLNDKIEPALARGKSMIVVDGVWQSIFSEAINTRNLGAIGSAASLYAGAVIPDYLVLVVDKLRGWEGDLFRTGYEELAKVIESGNGFPGAVQIIELSQSESPFLIVESVHPQLLASYPEGLKNFNAPMLRFLEQASDP